MIRMTDGYPRVPANDNPLRSWRGICAACGADMGPRRDARYCRSCLVGERHASTPAQDALWALLLVKPEVPPVTISENVARRPRW